MNNDNSSSSIQRRWVWRYCLAFVAVAAGFGLRWALTALAGEGLPTYITFYPLVMVVALLGGVGPGLLATLTTALAVDYLIIPPLHGFAIANLADAVGLAFFTGMGVFMSVFAELYRRARQKAAAHEMEIFLRKGRETPTHWFRQGWLINAGLVVTLVILATAGLQSVRNIRAVAESDKWERHSYVVIQGLDQLLSAFKDTETGQRCYLLTGDEKYLEPYLTGLHLVQTNLVSLKQLTRDNVRQQQRLADIEALIQEKFVELQQTIELRRTQGLPAALAVVGSDKGKTLMDQIRKRVTEAQDEESRLLQQRMVVKSANAGKTLQTLLASSVLSFLLLVTLFLYLKQENYRRFKAEAEQYATSQYARSLLEASLDPLVTISQDGKITDVNKATESVTGVPRERLIGTDFARYFTEPQKAAAGYQKVLAEGQVRDYPLTILHTSGRTTEVLYHATVYRNEAGVMQGVFAAARDVTELKKDERRLDFTNALLALFAQKTTYKEYLDSVVELIRVWTGSQCLGVRVADTQGNIPFVAHVGYDAEFLRLENQLSLLTDCCLCIRAISQKTEVSDAPLLTVGGSFRLDDSLAFARQLSTEQQKDYRGTCMKFAFASLAVIPIRYRDRVLGAIHLADRRPGQFPPASITFLESMAPLIGEALHRFSTEAELARHRDHLEELVKLRTAELARSNEDLEQFAYVASHDLQEPLRAVGGYVELLRHRFPEKLDDKALQYIAGAAAGATRMQTLITDLLAFSRVGTRGHAFAPADLNMLLAKTLENLQASIQEVHATVTSDPLPSLLVDGTQIVQLFQNLIGNALKFRSERPLEIHIGAQRQEDRWVFFVRDNGIGIEPQYFQRIFQLFQRLHTRRHYPGTGIGLAICKKIAERHGGEIWVESQPGQGSTFFFSIPQISDMENILHEDK
jgi:PAS domain S-box-containing protein